MHKLKAIELLGGTTALAAKAIGVSYQAVDKWPVELPPRIEDRVIAAVARQSSNKEKPFVIGEGLQGASVTVWQKDEKAGAV